MSENQPRKSTKGRKPAPENRQKILIRESLPMAQVHLAKATAERLGMSFNEFIETAIKEEIYRAQIHMAAAGGKSQKP